MVLVVVVLACAVVAGWLLGGRLRNLADVRLRSPWLAFVAVGLLVLLSGLGLAGVQLEAVTLPIVVASQAALLAFVAANRYLPGMPLVLVGFALNALVIVANGGMPVDPEALRAVGGASATIDDPGRHRLLEPGDAFPLLADIIGIPLLRTVVSVGDLLLAAGVGILVAALMRRFPPPPGRRTRGASSGASRPFD